MKNQGLKVVEAEKVNIHPFPEPKGWRTWLRAFKMQMISLSGRPAALVLRWVEEMLRAESWEDIPHRPSFDVFEHKLLMAFQHKLRENPEINRSRGGAINLIQAELFKKYEALYGRQYGWLIFQDYKWSDELDAIADWKELYNLKMKPG